MSYRVNYLATDGAVRWTEVEAESAEDAERIAWENDASTSACGDNIVKIISVE